MIVRVIIWLVVIGGAVGAGLYFYLQDPVVQVTAAPVGRGDVQDTIPAVSSGVVKPVQKSMVAAAGIGVIQAVHVEEGQRVEVGDLLVELKHDELDAQVNLTRANLEAGKSRLKQAQLGADIADDVSGTQLGQARAQYDAALREYERMRTLAERDAISDLDFQQAELAMRVAREGLSAAQAGQGESAVRAEEIKSVEATLDQLQAAVEVAEATREKAFIRAPIGGVVAQVLLQPGEAVAMGMPLLHLVKDDDLYIEAPFDEANLANVKVGMKARVEMDAYRDETFQGEVTFVSPVVATTMTLSRTLNVKVRMLEGLDRLRAGMSADVTIIAEEKNNVLVVPTESLERQRYAYVIENGHAVRREVETGIGNWEYFEIMDGLQEGEELITSVAAIGLEDGVEVEIVPELILE
jgi:HlyD family secretion protein